MAVNANKKATYRQAAEDFAKQNYCRKDPCKQE
ncbi:hypothetical protein CCACVL1_00059 [Corchorus capsularis]|uniref:Uncharacterized protein n=1 Tax=Corchorus capsularis TaxID=210143 RepID=A0A1R3KYU4_COCAP|nr:hypothetical protein CCACVL1_00059 [Corchorus capsularis]